MRRFGILVLAPPLALLLTLLSLAVVPAVVDAQADGFVRVAHLSPDAPAVDVYVDGTKVLSDVPYKTVSNYLPVPAGSHTFKVTAAGQTTAVISATETIAAGTYYTVAAIGPLAQIKAAVFTDDLAAPPAGDAKIRAVHAAVGAPSPVDVLANGKPAFTGLAFGNATQYAPVPAGTYTLGVAPSGSTTAAFSAMATLMSGDVYTAFAIGNGSSQPYGLLLVNDSAAAGMAGAPRTGGGWLATHGQVPQLPLAPILTGALGVLLVCVGAVAWRRLAVTDRSR
jgi:hypothetical protein